MTVLANFKAVVIEHLGFVLVRMDSMEQTAQVSGICSFLKNTGHTKVTVTFIKTFKRDNIRILGSTRCEGTF